MTIPTSLARLPSRAAKVLAHHGPVGTVKRVARELRPARRTSSTLVWYALDLAAGRPHPQLDEGLVLRPGTADDLPLVGQLPVDPRVRTMTPWWVSEQLRQGAAMWLVHAGARAAFRCWIFRNWFPMGGVRGGGVRLPADVVVRDDSLTAPAFRGRSVAPAATAAIADAYRDQGVRWMFAKINADNAPSRRAAEKAGFREAARMQILRRDWRTRIRVFPRSDDPSRRWLQALERG